VTTTTEADELIALAHSKSLILTVYQNRRWDSEFRTLRHLTSPSVNALGELTDVTIHYDIPSPAWISGWTERDYRPGEGMLFGLGSHSIDQALLLMGRPSKVTGWIRALRDGMPGDGRGSEVDDTFVVVLEYEGKATMVTVKTTVVSVLREPLKYMVRGREGTYVKWGECVQEKHTGEGRKADEEGFGVEEERLWGDLTTKREVDGARQTKDEASGLWVGKFPTIPGYWRGLYENVVGAIRGEVELEVKPEQSRDGIRVMELARQSWKEGKAVPWS
jgi:predicted dehydrogenase